MLNELKERILVVTEEIERQRRLTRTPLQIAYFYEDLEDVEIVAFLASWVAFGHWKVQVRMARELDDLFRGISPRKWIMEGRYAFLITRFNPLDYFYGIIRYQDIYLICERMHSILKRYGTLYNAFLSKRAVVPHHILQDYFNGITGIPSGKEEPCPQLNLFLRFMVRNTGGDIGLWKYVLPSRLVLPMDTATFKKARFYGITKRQRYNLDTALEITNTLRQVFVNDPVRGSFFLSATLEEAKQIYGDYKDGKL